MSDVTDLLQSTWKGDAITAHMTDDYVGLFLLVGAVTAKWFLWE